MPSSTLQHHPIIDSAYGFSATRIENLGASEYTLAVVTADVSGSVHEFLDEIEGCLREVVKACARSPRADNLLLRTTAFDDQVREIHGFRPLTGCLLSDYEGCLRTGGTTALHDAAHNALQSVTAYGRDLGRHGFSVNGIVFVITDGMDNASAQSAASVARAAESALRSEQLQSISSVLVGVNVADDSVSRYLAELRRTARFDQYVEIAHADADTLARLADFVARSISAQSVALNSGGVSRPLTF
ncbi:MAG: hypothetical protein JRI23_06765 [Deltaproteobacteria bacterium]|jgi:hypothetical protein|nr:hypothetical protein [Deltaproteobacteria bacterium]MBW2531289.1 hypothetical protein [Deltaproteobacteria bacterium]